MIKLVFIFWFTFLSLLTYAQESLRFYLSGTDKDHTKTWDFFCTNGMKSGKRNKIEVPSQ